MKMIPWKKKDNATARGGEGASSFGLFTNEMNRLMDRLLENPWNLIDEDSFAFVTGWAPSFDVIDGENEVSVRAEIPGVDPKEVEVTVLGNVLTISGEKREAHKEKEKHVYRSECSYGSFRRSVELPEGVDAERISAEHATGILTVRVGKSKASATKRVPVSVK